MAVKKFEMRCDAFSDSAFGEFEAHVMVASIVSPYPILLQLVGFCVTETQRFLVYPYMTNGNVEQWLRQSPPSKPPLDWATRVCIAFETAKGLSYLHDHCNPKIKHRYVIPAKIFLNEDFKSLIGGFDLALLMDREEEEMDADAIKGTFGFMAPEYFMVGRVSIKTDVFRYGMMLFEHITGKSLLDFVSPFEENVTGIFHGEKLKLKAALMDPDLHPSYYDLEHLVVLALLCTQESHMDRPKMSEVVTMLQEVGLVERWEDRLHFIMEKRKREIAPYFRLLDSPDNQSVELSSPR